MMNKSPLRRSVITSSSSRELVDVFREVSSVVGPDIEFDLMALREPDVSAIESEHGPLSPPAKTKTGDPLFPRTFTEIMAEDENLKPITEWTLKQFSLGRARLSALATYFPNLTSAYHDRRQCAIKAVVNSVRLALALADWGFADDAVVEVVCGTILDPCECDGCVDTGTTFVSTDAAKFEVLIDSLEEVVSSVRQLQAEQKTPDKPFALGVELEPGEIYLLRDKVTLDQFFERLDARCDRDERRETPIGLRRHVGLNLDIAHMRIASVKQEHLAPYVDRIVHAHIADHPRMHTRDQAVGSWTSIDRLENEFSPYLQLLNQRLASCDPGNGLPFTGAVALELEGCNRIGWINESLSAMKRMSHHTAQLVDRNEVRHALR